MIQEELGIEMDQCETRAPEQAATSGAGRKADNFPSQPSELTRIEENYHGYG